MKDIQDSEAEFMTLSQWLEQPIHSPKNGLSQREWLIKINGDRKDRINSLCTHLDLGPATIKNLANGLYIPKSEVRQKIADFIGQPILWTATDNKFFVTFNNN